MNSVGLPIRHEYNEWERQNYLVYQLVAMVVEECKTKWDTDGSGVYKKMSACGAIDYLVQGYDCLHTQSMDYIINDIEEILKEHEKVGAAYEN
jgi:hypothetical protein